jgi:hypothetical protein
MTGEIARLKAEIADLQGRLDYYTGRGQAIMDMLAEDFHDLLANRKEVPLTAAQHNTIRQFLRDQGIIDLKTGDSPTNHLKKKYPFAGPTAEAEDFGNQEGTND